MKKNSGVSIITLIITIIILIIIAGMTIYYGSLQNIDKTSDTMTYNEIFEVSEATAQRALMNRLNSSTYGLVGIKLSDDSPVEINGISYGDGWYKLEAETSKELNLEKIKKDYIINYDTGEVVSFTPIFYEDKELYSSTDVKEVVGGGDTNISSDMYDKIKQVNKPYLVSGMIPVKYDNGKWKVTTASDEKWYDYSKESNSWANIMLMDEIKIDGYTNEQIREISPTELEGLEVTTTGSMFVWIPRYSSDSSGNIVYSYLCTDYLENGYSVSDAFSNPTKELTGVWISKYDVEYK